MKLNFCTKFALRLLQMVALEAPELIRAGDVMRFTESPLDAVECFNPEKNTCPQIGVSKSSRALQQAASAFLAVLDDLTVAHIASNKAALSSGQRRWKTAFLHP